MNVEPVARRRWRQRSRNRALRTAARRLAHPWRLKRRRSVLVVGAEPPALPYPRPAPWRSLGRKLSPFLTHVRPRIGGSAGQHVVDELRSPLEQDVAGAGQQMPFVRQDHELARAGDESDHLAGLHRQQLVSVTVEQQERTSVRSPRPVHTPPTASRTSRLRRRRHPTRMPYAPRSRRRTSGPW